MRSWWLGLRQLFRSRDRVTIEGMGVQFDCPNTRTKASALCEVAQWVHGDYHRVSQLATDFRKAQISLTALNERYLLDEQQLKALARHPLASIGGHTVSHAVLTGLDEASARAEIADNRRYLEDLLQFRVRHLAYPYGNARACGPREEGLAREAGFRTAVTTQPGQLGEPSPNRFALPRIVIGEADTRPSAQARISGLRWPLKARGNTEKAGRVGPSR